MTGMGTEDTCGSKTRGVKAFTCGKRRLTVAIKLLDHNGALSLRLRFALLTVAGQSMFGYSVLLCDGKAKRQKREKDLK